MAKYIPKIYHFSYERMKMGGMLAALDNNFNCGREHICGASENEGKLH